MKQILRYLFFSLFIIQPILSEVKPVPPGPPKEGYYIITYKSTGINLEILANGYVVRSGESIEDSSGQADINYWVIPGTNIIKIRLTERKRTKKDQTNFPPEAEVKLMLGQKGQFPDEGILLQQ